MKTPTLLSLAAISLVACGKADDQTSEDESTAAGVLGTSGLSSEDAVPTIAFAVPDSLSSDSFSLVQDEGGKTVIERRAERMDRIVAKLNRVIERLNSDRVSEEGSFSGRGPDGLLSGLIDEADDETFDKRATICHDGTPFMQIQWNVDGSLIQAYRDFSIRPFGMTDGSSLVSRVDYSNQDDVTTLEVHVHGTPWFSPEIDRDGDVLAEANFASIDANGLFQLRAVNDWMEAAGETFEGDGYLTGEVDEEGVGEFVGYRKGDERCSGEFDEDATEAPGWCLGREVGSDERFNDDERDAAWDRLATIGLGSSEDLEEIVMPDNLSCE